MSVSLATAAAGSASECSKVSDTAGNPGNPTAGASSTARVFGIPTTVRAVIPNPPSAAAHKPDRLGVVNTSLQGIPALSNASIAAERNTHGGANAAKGNGSAPSPFKPGHSGRPIHAIGTSATRSACGAFTSLPHTNAISNSPLTI